MVLLWRDGIYECILLGWGLFTCTSTVKAGPGRFLRIEGQLETNPALSVRELRLSRKLWVSTKSKLGKKMGNFSTQTWAIKVQVE